MVGIQWHIGVFQKHPEAGFSVEHIVQRLGQWITGQQAAQFTLLLAPLEEVLDDRLSVLQTVLTFLVSAQTFCLDGLFGLIKPGDLLQGSIGPHWVIGQRLDKVTTTVHPAPGVGDILLGGSVAGIGRIAVTDQGAVELLFQHLLNMDPTSAVRIGEHHFVINSINRVTLLICSN